jgi:hypothetical protein
VYQTQAEKGGLALRSVLDLIFHPSGIQGGCGRANICNNDEEVRNELVERTARQSRNKSQGEDRK